MSSRMIETQRSEYRVVIQSPAWMNVPGDVRVHTDSLELPRLVAGHLADGEIMDVLVDWDDLTAQPGRYAPFAPRIDAFINDPDPGKFSPALDAPGDLGCTIVIPLRRREDLTVAVMATSKGVPVCLAEPENCDPSLLLELTRYMLYDHKLDVPIEPLYSTAEAIAAGARSCRAGCQPGRDFFVDPVGRVSLSARWARRGEFLGNIGQSPAEWAGSDLWQRLAARIDELFISQFPCAFCEHYAYCRGFVETGAEPQSACEAWRPVFDALRTAYRSVMPS